MHRLLLRPSSMPWLKFILTPGVPVHLHRALLAGFHSPLAWSHSFPIQQMLTKHPQLWCWVLRDKCEKTHSPCLPWCQGKAEVYRDITTIPQRTCAHITTTSCGEGLHGLEKWADVYCQQAISNLFIKKVNEIVCFQTLWQCQARDEEGQSVCVWSSHVI
jgi:hypothetical protein